MFTECKYTIIPGIVTNYAEGTANRKWQFEWGAVLQYHPISDEFPESIVHSISNDRYLTTF